MFLTYLSTFNPLFSILLRNIQEVEHLDSFQNLALLENLYRLKALGYKYIDPITPNPKAVSNTLPGTLHTLSESISSCYLCDLSKSRRQSMSGFGNPKSKIMFVDAFVSAAEDESNEYFVGRSGTMLRDMIEKVLNLPLDEIYFTHAVKCKPFGFQIPSTSECTSCLGYLTQQISIINPKIIVPLGAEAYQMVSGDDGDFERMRGEVIPWGDALMIPLYHPLYLIRNPSMKKEAMRDLQTIKGQLG